MGQPSILRNSGLDSGGDVASAGKFGFVTLDYKMSTTMISKKLSAAFGLVSLLAANSQAAVVTAAYINANVNQVIYNDDFDAAVNANWDVAQSANGAAALDSAHQFGFDYAAGGTFGPFNGANAIPAGRIPAAPSGTGTRGLIMRAQDVDDAGTDLTQGIALFTKNLPAAPATPYAVRFDMWANWATGTGSSEFAFYGVGGTKQTSIGTLSAGGTGFDTPPAPLPGTGASAGVGPVTTGYTFATSGDGGFARDIRTFVGSAEQISDANFYSKNVLNPAPTPPATTPLAGTLANPAQDALLIQTQLGAFPNATAPAVLGVPGNQWLDIIMYYDGVDLTSYINGKAIYTQPGATVNWGQMFLGYMDMNSSVSLPAVQTFAVFDNFRVAVPEPGAYLFGSIASAVVGMIAYRRRKSA
jgi:hypothetical protein